MMKKIKLFTFTIISFLCFGLVNVNAQTTTVTTASDFKAALNNATIDEVKLGANINISDIVMNSSIENFVYLYNVNKTLDLNGYTITTDADTYLYLVFDKDGTANTFTLKDSSASGTGKIYVNNVEASYDMLGGESHNKEVTINIEGGTYEYGTYYKEIGNTFTFNNASVGNNNENAIVNVNIKNAKFINQTILFTGGENGDKVNISIESVIFNGKRLTTNVIGKTVNNLIKSGSTAYTGATVLDSTSLSTSTNEYYINEGADNTNIFTVYPADGLSIDSKSNSITYGSTTPIDIPIKNVSKENAISVTNVTSSNPNFIISGSCTSIAAGSTCTEYKITPVLELYSGNHSTTITVSYGDGKTVTTTYTFVVEKANIVPVASITGWTYGSTANTPSVTGNTENGTILYEYKVSGTQDSTYTTEVPTNAGNYILRATITETTNYNSGVDTADFTISKKVVTIDYLSMVDHAFDDMNAVNGVYYTLSAPLSLLSSDSKPYAKEGSNKYVGTQTGVYKFVLNDEAYKNYTFAEGKIAYSEDTFEITPKTLPLEIKQGMENPEISKTESLDLSTLISLYNIFTEISYVGDVSYIGTDLKTGVSLNGSILSASSNAVADQVSRVTVKFAGKDLNGDGINDYAASPDLIIDVKVVDRPAQVLNKTLSNESVEYGSTYSNPISLTTGDGILSYASSDPTVANINASTGAITINKVGTTTITITASKTANYSETTFTYNLEVTPRALTVSIGTYNLSKIYDGNTIAGTETGNLVITGVIGEDDVGANVNKLAYTDANVHTENILMTLGLYGGDKDNYSLETTSISVPCAITQKQVHTPIVTVAETSSYDGNAKTPVVTFKDGMTTLDSSQYDLTYSNNIDAGTASVKVTAKLTSNYTWTEVTKNFTIAKANYTGTQLIYTKEVFSDTVENYIVSLSEIANILPDSFKNISIADVTNLSTEGLISAHNYSSGDDQFTFTTSSKSAGIAADINVIISSKNYNNYTFIVRAIAIDKELVIISGLTYTSRAYNNNPMIPTGTLAVSDNKVPVEYLNVLYEGVDGTTYSSATAPTNVGKYKVIYSVPESNSTYTGSTSYSFEITKANPTYVTPTELFGVRGTTLSTITLPEGWAWSTPTAILNTTGNISYEAKYTPSDLTNYNVITLDLTIYVKDLFVIDNSVSGGNGSISADYTIVEGTDKTITFTPAIGYMVDNVKVNNVLVQITNNEYTITNINENKNVIVTYKKIPFTLTINNPKGANPNGTISVNYGDNKDIVITVNLGYKLISVKVDGLSQTLPLTDNKLTLTNITADTNVVITVEAIVYKVIDGANQKYYTDKNTVATFKIDADLELLNGIYIDSKLIDSSNYDLEEGSTIIIFKADFFKKLSSGKHTLRAMYTTGGSATTNFTITSSIENPNTVDNTINYIIFGTISILGIAGSTIYLRKRYA